jgi:hypothetical protein
MSRNQEHDVGLLRRLFNVLCDLAIVERLLGKHHPVELTPGVILYSGRARAISGATLLT